SPRRTCGAGCRPRHATACWATSRSWWHASWASAPVRRRRSAMTAVLPRSLPAVYGGERFPEKVQPGHRERLAVVYVRQSTAQQVLEHRESTRLQYGLTTRALELGWAEA